MATKELFLLNTCIVSKLSSFGLFTQRPSLQAAWLSIFLQENQYCCSTLMRPERLEERKKPSTRRGGGWTPNLSVTRRVVYRCATTAAKAEKELEKFSFLRWRETDLAEKRICSVFPKANTPLDVSDIMMSHCSNDTFNINYNRILLFWETVWLKLNAFNAEKIYAAVL